MSDTGNADTGTLWRAEGWLSWPPGERRTDRYGLVSLFAWRPTITDDTPPLDLTGVGGTALPAGVSTRLVATVLESAQSDHVGDLFRGIYPPKGGTPVGTVLVLGEGEPFVERDQYGTYLGLRPTDGRKTDWLDPQVLYRLHGQRVRLDLVALDPA